MVLCICNKRCVYAIFICQFSGEEPHYKENMDQVEQRAEK